MRVGALRGGVVTELRVKEGDRVVSGQPLFTVASRQGLEAGGTLDAAVLASLDTQIQVLKEQIAADPERVANEVRRLDAAIVSVAAERDALGAQRRLMAERVQVTEDRRGTVARLTQQGHSTRTALQEQDEALLARRQALAEIDRDLAAADKELGQTQLQREQLPVQQAERLAQLRLGLADRERQKAEAQGQRAQVLTAPIAGHVTALQAAPGQIVDPAKPLLTLLPDGASLLAELFVPSRAIGFVEPGQRVRLMVDAFPYQRFGTIGGSVETVSQAVLSPNEVIGRTTLTEPAYRVTVRLDRQAIDAFGRRGAAAAGHDPEGRHRAGGPLPPRLAVRAADQRQGADVKLAASLDYFGAPRLPAIIQSEAAECGLACLAMVATLSRARGRSRGASPPVLDLAEGRHPQGRARHGPAASA